MTVQRISCAILCLLYVVHALKLRSKPNLGKRNPLERGADALESEAEVDDCTICLLALETNVFTAECSNKHMWHVDCIFDQIIRSPTCPNCRAPFSRHDIENLATEVAGTTLSPSAVELGRKMMRQLLLDDRVRQGTDASFLRFTKTLFSNKYASIPLEGQPYGNVLLHAASKGYVEAVVFLLDNGAPIEVVDKQGWTPLSFAARNGHHQVVQFLLTKSATISEFDAAFRHASIGGHLEIVEALMTQASLFDSHRDEGAVPTIDVADMNGNTALMFAVFYGHYDVFKYLTRHGARVDAINMRGQNALMYATRDSDLKFWTTKKVRAVVAELDYDDSPSKLCNAMLIAAQDGNEWVVELLYRKGVSIKIVDRFERPPLMLAVENGHLAVVKLLVGYITDSTLLGMPLLSATKRGHLEIMKVLVQNGAPFNAVDILALAVDTSLVRSGMSSVVAYLIGQSNPSVHTLSNLLAAVASREQARGQTKEQFQTLQFQTMQLLVGKGANADEHTGHQLRMYQLRMQDAEASEDGQ